MPPKNNSRRMDELLASVTEDLLNGDPQQFEDNSIRVERILLELVRPDPLQPRRVLPDRIYQAFHAGQMTPTQALRDLIQVAQLAARQHGRPFNNVLELLPSPDDEQNDEPDTKLSPEEQLLYDLINLAITIRDDGQVNPLTVVDVSQGVTRQFRIETGERRYWATWLLRDFIPGYSGDGVIPCIVIPAEQSSVFRQAKENTARSGLSAIAMARQAALLLLHLHRYEMPDGPVTIDLYRLALELRISRGDAESIYSAMGGITKQRFNQYKDLLRLSDEAIEMADRHSLDEYTLRPILQLPLESHAEMVQQIIRLGLTGRQVRDIIERGIDDTASDSVDETAPYIRSFVKSMPKMTNKDESDFIRGLLNQEQSVQMARARIESTIAFLLRIQDQLPKG